MSAPRETSERSPAALLFRQAPCVFFDCDGVIFDSNGFKLEALRHTLAGYPAAAVSAMERYWTAHGGMARYPKLEHFFRQILPTSENYVAREPATREIELAALRFGEFARQAFVAARPIPEALKLARLAGSERCFVVSGADQAELRDIFHDKQLTQLFNQICGSPTAKLDHVQRILQERQCPPERALLIGDGAIDFEVCRTLGIPFFYLDQYSEWSAAKSVLETAPNVAAFDSWGELFAHLAPQS